MSMETATSSSKPLFSVIIPNYNYGRYLPRAIESVLNQSLLDVEVIVVDDGSTDDSLNVLQKYVPQIKVISQKNGGVSVARNHGASESNGEYLLFLDADDELTPGALDHFKSAIAGHHQAGIFIAHHFSVDEYGQAHEGKPQPVFRSRFQNFSNFLNRRFGIVHGSIVFKREVFSQLEYPPGITNGEDLVIFAQALALYDAVPVPFATARIHAHAGRARDNIAAIRKIGFSTVDLLFNPAILPAEYMRFKPEFTARKALSMGRAFLKAKSFAEAQSAYAIAWNNNSLVFLNLTHALRAFKAWLKV